jgi:tripartite-type tricarboxylate transporter receptor subunit TctC
MKFRLACCALATALAPTIATADYPEKPVRMIVPAAPGGGADFVARAIASSLGVNLGQPVIIENRAGASGTIGAELTAKAAPDGYTLLMAQSTSVTIAPHIYKKLNYDTLTDFAPVTLAALAPNILVVHPSVPANSVKELIALARAKPGALNFGSSGSGAPSHLAGEIFNSMAGVDMVHVPYKGAGLAVTALLGGTIQVMFAPMVAVMTQVKANRLRALGVTSTKPSQTAPDLPTIADSGLTGYEISSWFGIFAPARTPQAIVERLFQETAKVLKQAEIKERFAQEGAEPVGNTPKEFNAYVRAEYVKYAKVVKDTGVTPE